MADRPKEPGFPVQRAGAAGMKDAHSHSSIRDSGLPSVPKASAIGNNQYWMGPKKINNTRSSSLPGSSATGSTFQAPISNTYNPPPKNFKASPKPILGPKTIRVEVNNLMIHACHKRIVDYFTTFKFSNGRLAQLVRATGLHPVGHRFESCAVHHIIPHNQILCVTSFPF